MVISEYTGERDNSLTQNEIAVALMEAPVSLHQLVQARNGEALLTKLV